MTDVLTDATAQRFRREPAADAAEPGDGRLSPVERLEALCDPGSLTLMRSDVRSTRMGGKARAGDGVVTGTGRVDGRRPIALSNSFGFGGHNAVLVIEGV